MRSTNVHHLNNLNQSETTYSHSNGFSKAQFKKMKTADSYEGEIEHDHTNNNNKEDEYYDFNRKKTASENASSVGSLNN